MARAPASRWPGSPVPTNTTSIWSQAAAKRKASSAHVPDGSPRRKRRSSGVPASSLARVRARASSLTRAPRAALMQITPMSLSRAGGKAQEGPAWSKIPYWTIAESHRPEAQARVAISWE